MRLLENPIQEVKGNGESYKFEPPHYLHIAHIDGTKRNAQCPFNCCQLLLSVFDVDAPT